MDCAEGAQEIPPGSEKLHDDKSLRELHEQEIPRSHEIEKFTFLPPFASDKISRHKFYVVSIETPIPDVRKTNKISSQSHKRKIEKRLGICRAKN